MRVQFIQDLIDKARGKNFDKNQIPVNVADVWKNNIDLLFEKFDFAEFEINGSKRKYLTNVNADRGVTEQTLSLLCDSFPDDRSRIKVLNIGCGKKSQNDFMSTLGFDVYGIDFDIDVDSERVKFHDLNTQNDIPFEGIQFDCVVSQEIIEHIENPWLLFRKIKKVLKIDGALIVTTPNISSSKSKRVFVNNNLGFFSYFDPDNLWQHINPIPFWEMIHLSRYNGFELVRLSGCNMYYIDYVPKHTHSSNNLREEVIIQNNDVLHYVFRNLNSNIKLYNPVPTHNYSWDKPSA